MQLYRFNDPKQFFQYTLSHLMCNEAENNLPLGIAGNLVKHPERYSNEAYLAAVISEEKVHGVALHTPPYPIILSRMDVEELRWVTAGLLREGRRLTGCIAPGKTALVFSELWEIVTGYQYKVSMKQGIYKLQTLKPITYSTGKLRLARHDEAGFLIRWCKAFHEETINSADHKYCINLIHNKIDDGSLYVWENGQAVSIAGISGKTPNGTRLSLVYTPKRLRGKGYATSCVGAISKKLLENGNQFCFLYTDMDNPTSNKIYKNIGYEFVCDSMECEFYR